ALSTVRYEPSAKASTPSSSQALSSVFLDSKSALSRPSGSTYKPLPTPPPSLPSDVRLGSKNLPPRMPHEQRIRGGSLPLLSIEQFNQHYPDDEEDEDESIMVTPSRPPKRLAPQPGKQSVPPLPTPSASISS